MFPDGSQISDPGERWNQSFWVTYDRNSDGNFTNGKNLSISEAFNSKANLTEDPENNLSENLNKKCSVIIANQTDPGQFLLKAADCNNEQHLVMCRTSPINETISQGLDAYGFPCEQGRDNSSSRSDLVIMDTQEAGNGTIGNDTEVNNTSVTCEEGGADDDDPIGIQKLDLMFNPCKEKKKEQLREASRKEYDQAFGKLDLQKSFEHLFELLWYSQLPCFDVENVTSSVKDEMSLIKRCYWKGQEISCSSIFVTRPTDRGMCCSFNMEKAEKMFREGRYGSMVSSMQHQDSLGSFDNTSLPDWYQERDEPATQPGQNKGLTIVLDAHTDMVSSGSISDNFKGFVTVVDDSNNYPQTQTNGILLRPGRENHVAMTALEIFGTEAIRSIAPTDRDCYFSDEHHLEEHQQYSQSNCELECSMKYARLKMKERNATNDCTPWFYPIADSDISQFCDPWDTAEFQRLMALATDCSCLPDCTKTIYEATVSAAPFRQCDHTNLGTSQLCDLEDVDMNPPIWQQLVQNEYISAQGDVPEFASPTDARMSNTRKFVSSEEKQAHLVFQVKNNKTPEYDAYTNDIAIVNFYFDKSTVMLYKRDQRMTMIDYISQMGGLLGLGIGCSFISIIELFYWMTIRLGRNIGESKKS